jgi:hypothetical protein
MYYTFEQKPAMLETRFSEHVLWQLNQTLLNGRVIRVGRNDRGARSGEWPYGTTPRLVLEVRKNTRGNFAHFHKLRCHSQLGIVGHCPTIS